MFQWQRQGKTVVGWHIGTPTPSEAREEIDAVRETADDVGQASLLIVIEGAKAAPSSETRAVWREASEEGPGRVNAIALVVLQKGVIGAAIRTIAKAIVALIARERPVRLFGDVRSAARWVEKTAGESSRDLEACANALRRKLG